MQPTHCSEGYERGTSPCVDCASRSCGGLTHEEIASAIGIDHSTSVRAEQRGLDKLRRALQVVQ